MEIAELLKEVKVYDWDGSREPLRIVDVEIRQSHGQTEHLKSLEDGLMEIVQSDAGHGAKRFAYQKLSQIATERSIPALASKLTHADEAEMARYTLERIPSTATVNALRSALSKTQGRTKIGIINSLGVRREASSTSQLGELLSDADPAVAAAAAWSLGKIGNAAALDILAKAKDTASGSVRLEILHALLACAEATLTNGGKIQAMAVYSDLKAESMPKPVRNAAVRGLLQAAQRT